MFQAAMVSSAVNRANRLISYLQTVPIFSSLSPQMLDQLAKSMNKECFQDGEYIIRQGETGDKFYVLYRGRVRITKTKPESPLVETYMLTLKAGKGRRDEQRARSEASGDDGANSDILVEGDNELGCVFGERALLKRETRAANAVADGPVDAYSLDVTSFRLLLADVVDEMNQVNDLRVLRAAKLFAALSDR
jgi:cGMP-dependent protein kinase